MKTPLAPRWKLWITGIWCSNGSGTGVSPGVSPVRWLHDSHGTPAGRPCHYGAGLLLSAHFQSRHALIKTGADKGAGVAEKFFRLAPEAREVELKIEDRILLFGEVRPQHRPGGQRPVDADEGDLGGAVAVAQQGAQFGIGFQLLLGVRLNGARELHVNEQ